MTELTDLSETDADNTPISGANIAEGCAPSGINNAIRNTLGLIRRAFKTSIFRVRDATDQTKLLALDLSGLTTATTRTATMPDKSGTLAMTSDVAAIGNAINLALAVTVAANALTIAIKGQDGSDPTAASPVYVPFRSATANSGDVDVLTLTAATSLVVSSGSTLGTTNGVEAYLVVVGFNDAGTFRIGVLNPTSLPVKDGIASATAEGGAGAADSAGVIYAGAGVASKPMTVLGFIKITEAVAGTWSTAPSLVQTDDAAGVALQTTALTPWTAYTPTFTGFGTPSGISFFSRRVGDTLEVAGKFTTGVPTATEARITLPSGLTIDATKVPAIRHCGSVIRSQGTDAQYYVMANGGQAYFTLGVYNSSNDGLVSRNGSDLLSSGNSASVILSIPITGW